MSQGYVGYFTPFVSRTFGNNGEWREALGSVQVREVTKYLLLVRTFRSSR